MATVLAKRDLGVVVKQERRLYICKSDEEEYKETVAKIMRANGANEQLIQSELSDNAVKEALLNNFSAESLAWALMQ